jgi:membrane-bound ClpP family serine protease
MSTHRRIVPILLTAILALTWASPVVSADEHEFQFANGGSWRGDVGHVVSIAFMENGVRQTMEGTLMKVDGTSPYRLISVRGEIAGATATKGIFESDIVSMTLDGEGDGNDKASASKPLASEPKADAAAKGDARGGRLAPVKGSDGFLKASKRGVFFLPWEGQVGTLARHESIESIAEEADKYGPGQIIVLHINSPGGLVIEGDEISETLLDIKRRHRVVAWIKKAISAGAFTALHCDEIYFEKVGAMGSAVMFAGQKSIEGAQLAAWVKDFGDVAEAGGRNRIPAECMITRTKMASYDKDSETDEITWYADMRGEYPVSDNEQVLTLNAGNAFHSGYIDGIASTEEELAVLLDLEEWHEVSDHGRDEHARWHKLCERCKKDVQRIGRDLQLKPQQRLVLLKQLLAWYGRCEPVMLYDLGSPGGGEDELRRAIERESRARGRNNRG